ncbi:MAG: prepilin-type N-terminal cleavage/methylation protein [Caloramator sp.]|jgi:type IV pilus assembly protein PilA|uniref:type II secretion system protein n=1 Tax=Caloramator sp. TaxID=1871330 RepID=UPI001D7BF568|nr:type II secretion system protein [Caloramator sp.]MBZ4664296.1 prepilin-type N-terminal cleavage/methylation protein [Caloramator sp.]
MNKRNKKKGFTLIEMIVVVAIIAILVGIGVPQITKTIGNSKKQADIANAKTIAGMLQQKIAEGNLTEVTDPACVTKELLGVDVPQVKFKQGCEFYYTFDGQDELKIFINDDSTYDQVYPLDSSKNNTYK